MAGRTTKSEPCTVTPLTKIEQLYGALGVTVGKSDLVWHVEDVSSHTETVYLNRQHMSGRPGNAVSFKQLDYSEALAKLSIVTYPALETTKENPHA